MSGKSTLVVYYSKSGHTDVLARKIAALLDADLFRLTTPRYHIPYLGWVRAGRESLNSTLPPLDAVPDLQGYTCVVLGSPVWTSYPSTPMRAFVTQAGPLPGRIGAFLSSGGEGAQDKAFAILRDSMGCDLSATLALSEKAQQTPEADQMIAAFCGTLGAS